MLSPSVSIQPDSARVTPEAIRLSQVCFTYGKTASVLDAITFGIPVGQRVGILGHNGCGKTTLFRLMCGLLKPAQGKIFLLGDPVIPGQFYPQVGYLFQDPNDQLFSASVREDIAFGPTQMGCSVAEVEQRVDQALQETGIPGLANRPPHHLSGGEKQLAAIAGLLAMQPQILLCDEPTASLDMRARRRLLQLLQSTQQTLVVASHDLEFVLEVCERVILLHDGHIVADGGSRSILGDPQLMNRYEIEQPYSLRER